MVTSTGFSYANRFMGYVTESLIVVAIAYGFYKLWNHFYLDDEYFESLAPPANNQQVYCRVLVIGLDDAGKTRFTRNFCKGKDLTEHPRENTTGVYVNSVRLGSMRLDMWDVGGSEVCRRYWRDFLSMDLHAICFVVDSSNGPRFTEAREALHAFLDLRSSKGIPLILVANKQDKKQAVDPNAVYREMQLEEYVKSRPIHFVCVQTPLNGPRKGFMDTFRLFTAMGTMKNQKSKKYL